MLRLFHKITMVLRAGTSILTERACSANQTLLMILYAELFILEKIIQKIVSLPCSTLIANCAISVFVPAMINKKWS